MMVLKKIYGLVSIVIIFNGIIKEIKKGCLKN